MAEWNAEDCCGNGCANCVLDVHPKKPISANKQGKRNIIETYQKFRLLSKKPHVPLPGRSEQLSDVVELHFSCANQNITADCILDIPPGHHIMLRAPLVSGVEQESESGVSSTTWLRPYSPYWVDEQTLEFKILVNLQPQGNMSKYLSGLKPGDEAEFRGPIGSAFMYTPSGEYTHKGVFIITQGVAIAPALRIVRDILDNEEDCTRIWHLACFSDLAHAYFRGVMQEFSGYWNYTKRIYLAHQQCGNVECMASDGCSMECKNFVESLLYREMVLSRRLELEELRDVCASVHETMEWQFVITGARTFQDSVVEMIKQLEMPKEKENIFLL